MQDRRIYNGGKDQRASSSRNAGIANILGENVFSEDFGVLLIKAKSASIKISSSGHISVNAPGNDDQGSVFEDTTKQLIRVKKCTRCGKCTESCVVVKYFDRILPDYGKI